MSSTKQYSIIINGLKESADAVDVLNKQLDLLEERLDKLNKKGISVNAGGGSSRASELTAEQKIADQINAAYEKRIALEGELGKELQNEKQLMKEVNAEAKAAAAKDRLSAGGYASNTMLGMKQELYDIKAAMQTTDIGSDAFAKMTQRANELTEKLKQIEQSYGTFSRNVGNYSNSILDSFKQITVKVGDTELKFNSLKQAQKELGKSMDGLAAKRQQDTEEYKNLAKALHEVNLAAERGKSAVDDLKKSSIGMDAAMDWMQSFGALGQISQGFSSMFGTAGFEENIQKLMSLQSILQGIENINKQMNTQEGIGKMFANGSKAVDIFVSKLTGAKIGMNGLEASTKTATYAVKGLSLAMKAALSLGIMLVIDKVIEGLEKLASVFTGAKNSAAESINSIDLVSNALEEQNKILDNRKTEIDLMKEKGLIDTQEAEKMKIEATNESLKQQIELLNTIARLNSDDDVWEQVNEGMQQVNNEDSLLNPDTYEKSKKGWQSLYNAFIGGLNIYEQKIEEGDESFTNHMANIASQLGMIRGNSDDVKNALVKNSQQVVGQFIQIGKQLINHTGEWTDQEKKMFQGVLDAMNDNSFLGSILMNLPAYLGKQADALQPVVDSIKAQLRSIGLSLNLNVPLTTDEQSKQLSDEEKQMKKESQLRIDAIKDAGERQRAQLRYNMQEELKQYKTGSKEYNLVVQKYQNQINDTFKTGGAARVKAAKATGKQLIDIEKEIQRAKLDAMADGLTKEITKLEQERNERLKKVEGNKQAEADINTYYNRKIADEQKKWHKEIEDGYRDMLNNIFSFTIETTSKLISTNESAAQRIYEDMIEYNEGLWENYFDSAAKVLNDDENLNLMKPLDVFKARIEQLNNIYNDAANESIEKLRKTYDLKNELLQKQKDKELQETSEWYNESIDKTNDYYDKLIDDTREKMKQLSDEEEKDNLQSDIEIWEQERTDRVLEIREQFYSRRSAIDKEYEEKQNELERQQYQDSDRLNKDHIDKQLGELRAFYNEINKLSDAQPVRNAFGFIKVGDTNKINKEVLDSLEEYKTQLQGLGEALNILRKTNSITYSTWYTANEEINRQIEGINKRIKETKEAMSWKTFVQDFFQEVQVYYSALSQSVQQVWSELDNLANYNLDRQQDALDKENEMLQDKLEEQEEILERHKNRVDDIEGKLQDARGDRKEALIDALNAEIIAQRRAQAEKERLEKEQKKLDERQKDLDYQRELAQYNSGLRQILFNTAQAVMSAAANKWATPAIPLMALATAAGGVQYALAKKQKPVKRADGGLINGRSHADGGVPILGTNIEVEGNEFVVRKSSTAQNLELLEYINSSQRKLNAIDLLEFFRNGGSKRIAANTSKTRFDTGGLLDLADYPSFNLGSEFAAYANRPVVVSVVDINERQSEVRNVRVLAGLNSQ